MATEYDGNGATFPTGVMLPDDGIDDRSAAAVNPAFEGLADRTAYLKLRADRVDALANIAALAAIAAPTDGLIRLVRGFGLYLFDTSGPFTPTGAMVVAPADATPGFWLWMGVGLTGVANGIPYLNAASQLVVPAGGFPTFTAPITTVRAVSVHDFLITAGLVAKAKTAAFAPFGGANFVADASNASMASGMFTFLDAPSATNTQGIQVCLDHYLHDGATLTQVLASIQPAGGHAALPTGSVVGIGVFRKQKFSAAFDSLRAASDFFSNPGYTLGTYETQHALTLVTDQNRVIDKVNYSYFVQLWDEVGNNSLPGLQIYGLEVTQSGIADMRFR